MPSSSHRSRGFAHPRDFAHLWAGSAMGHAGHQLTGIALPVLAVNTLDASEWQMGLLAAVGSAAFLVLGLPAGALVDRMSKRRVLVVADLVRAAALGGIVGAAILGQATMPVIYVAAVTIGCATVFFDVAHQSFVPTLAGVARVVEGNSRLQTTESIAQVAGPALAGQLLRVLTAGALIAVNAVAYLASAAWIARIRVVEEPPAERRPLLGEIGEGMRFVFGHRLLMRVVAATALSNLAWGIVAALEAVYILRHLGLSEATMGLIFSLAAVGGLLGAVSSGWISRRLGHTRSIPVSALALAAPVATLPLAASAPYPPVVLTAGLFVTFFAVVVYNVVSVSFRQRLCPPPLLGRMNATVRFVVWGTTPIGALVGGVLGERIGVVAALWVAAAGTALAALPVAVSELWSVDPSGSDQGVSL